MVLNFPKIHCHCKNRHALCTWNTFSKQFMFLFFRVLRKVFHKLLKKAMTADNYLFLTFHWILLSKAQTRLDVSVVRNLKLLNLYSSFEI